MLLVFASSGSVPGSSSISVSTSGYSCISTSVPFPVPMHGVSKVKTQWEYVEQNWQRHDIAAEKMHRA